MSLLQLKSASLTFGLTPLLDKVDLSIDSGERIAIVGRNGSGKSSLLKVLCSTLALDSGELFGTERLNIQLLSQTATANFSHSVYDEVVYGLGKLGSALINYHHLTQRNTLSPAELDELSSLQGKIDKHDGWSLLSRVDSILSKMQLPPDANISSLSGGMRRRVLLARCLVSAPDLLLLDEPTNHLDIDSIIWLETFLNSYNGTFLMVTHDRDFLSKTANRIIELDRGKIFNYPGDYQLYLLRQAERLAIEEREHALFDKRLKQEEVWLRQGVKARRTRNEGRVRALKSMRAERAMRREKMGSMSVDAITTSSASKILFEANNVSFSRADKTIIHQFSSLILSGDKIGIIGPNGCGKTTLLRLLLQELVPDSGSVKQGIRTEVAYFDQHRQMLDDSLSVIDNVAGGRQSVTVNGQDKHVISYLQDFLFSPTRARLPINQLSGGERNRLMLAKLFTMPSNVLIMDEPTNDLDVESLELLESLLLEYKGAVLLVSHDRAFVNNVVSSVWVYEGNGSFNECVGGYDDYCHYKSLQKPTTTPEKKTSTSSKITSLQAPPTTTSLALTVSEKRELMALPKQIEKLELCIEKLHREMLADDFYQQPSAKITAFQQQLKTAEKELAQAFSRWEILEERG